MSAMLAVFLNVATVLAGTLIGTLWGHRLSEGTKITVLTATGLLTLALGLKMAFEGQQILIIFLCLLLGGLTGHALRLEDRILGLGKSLQRLFRLSEGQAARSAEGFLEASVLFCVGAMTIIGSFQAGTTGDSSVIVIKSVMDGFMAIVLAGTYGPGVGLSALVILVYQGGLTLGAEALKPFVGEGLLADLTGLGGLMVAAIGFNLLKLKQIKTAEFLPALPFLALVVGTQPYWP